MKILYLTVKKKPFEAFKLRLKYREYRKPSQWIKSRLIDSETGNNKDYDVVVFRNGYNRENKYLVFSFKGYEISKKNYRVKYLNGLNVKVSKGYYRILLGPVVNLGNTEMKELF